MKSLITIQAELKAPKNQRNMFGKYNYRSAEDILEAVKPLLKKTSTHLTISDEIVMVGDRFYVRATATLTDSQGESVSVQGFAREEDERKGMDSAQVTGSTSSYARKFALNGLFCIDDNKDADQLPPPSPALSADMVARIASCQTKKDLLALWNEFTDADRKMYMSHFTQKKNEIR